MDSLASRAHSAESARCSQIWVRMSPILVISSQGWPPAHRQDLCGPWGYEGFVRQKLEGKTFTFDSTKLHKLISPFWTLQVHTKQLSYTETFGRDGGVWVLDDRHNEGSECETCEQSECKPKPFCPVLKNNLRPPTETESFPCQHKSMSRQNIGTAAYSKLLHCVPSLCLLGDTKRLECEQDVSAWSNTPKKGPPCLEGLVWEVLLNICSAHNNLINPYILTINLKPVVRPKAY